MELEKTMAENKMLMKHKIEFEQKQKNDQV